MKPIFDYAHDAHGCINRSIANKYPSYRLARLKDGSLATNVSAGHLSRGILIDITVHLDDETATRETPYISLNRLSLDDARKLANDIIDAIRKAEAEHEEMRR